MFLTCDHASVFAVHKMFSGFPRVLIDGVLRDDVVELDTEEGWALVHKKDEGGDYVIEGNVILEEYVFGRVEVEWDFVSPREARDTQDLLRRYREEYPAEFLRVRAELPPLPESPQLGQRVGVDTGWEEHSVGTVVGMVVDGDGTITATIQLYNQVDRYVLPQIQEIALIDDGCIEHHSAREGRAVVDQVFRVRPAQVEMRAVDGQRVRAEVGPGSSPTSHGVPPQHPNCQSEWARPVTYFSNSDSTPPAPVDLTHLDLSVLEVMQGFSFTVREIVQRNSSFTVRDGLALDDDPMVDVDGFGDA